jgi:hypothetical protein
MSMKMRGRMSRRMIRRMIRRMSMKMSRRMSIWMSRRMSMRMISRMNWKKSRSRFFQVLDSARLFAISKRNYALSFFFALLSTTYKLPNGECYL